MLEIEKYYTREEVISHPLPGAGTVLGRVFGMGDLSTVPNAVLEAAATRGAEIHDAIEQHIIHGITLQEANPNFEYDIYYHHFTEWENEFKPEYQFAELPFVHEKLGYKGIIDCLAIIEGKLVLIDWKTAFKADEFRAQMQQSLYAKALKDIYGIEVDEIRILSFNKIGWKFIRFDYDEQNVISLMNVYQIKKKAEGFIK